MEKLNKQYQRFILSSNSWRRDLQSCKIYSSLGQKARVEASQGGQRPLQSLPLERKRQRAAEGSSAIPWRISRIQSTPWTLGLKTSIWVRVTLIDLLVTINSTVTTSLTRTAKRLWPSIGLQWRLLQRIEPSPSYRQLPRQGQRWGTRQQAREKSSYRIGRG